MSTKQPVMIHSEIVETMIADRNAENDRLKEALEAAESALRAIQEIADEDLRRGDHPLQTGLFQIEATARAALASRHPA